jgi:hypothetical protein
MDLLIKPLKNKEAQKESEITFVVAQNLTFHTQLFTLMSKINTMESFLLVPMPREDCPNLCDKRPKDFSVKTNRDFHKNF